MKNFVFQASFVILTVYFVHWYLSRKFLSRASFRYFWNLLLLLTFIPVAVSGILWALGVKNFDFSFWHNQAGIIFTIVAILHLVQRLKYFLELPHFGVTKNRSVRS